MAQWSQCMWVSTTRSNLFGGESPGPQRLHQHRAAGRRAGVDEDVLIAHVQQRDGREAEGALVGHQGEAVCQHVDVGHFTPQRACGWTGAGDGFPPPPTRGQALRGSDGWRGTRSMSVMALLRLLAAARRRPSRSASRVCAPRGRGRGRAVRGRRTGCASRVGRCPGRTARTGRPRTG